MVLKTSIFQVRVFFLDIVGLQESVKVEALNKRFWFLCQHWLVDRKRQQGRFRDLIKAIPDMRILAAELKKVSDTHRLGFIFKVDLSIIIYQNFQ